MTPRTPGTDARMFELRLALSNKFGCYIVILSVRLMPKIFIDTRGRCSLSACR